MAENYLHPALRRDFWVSVPENVLRDSNLSLSEKGLYCYLVSYGNTGKAWPCQETIAKECGLSVRQVRRYLTNLNERGYIIQVKAGRGNLNAYQIPLMVEKLNRTNMSGLENMNRTNMSGLNRTNMSHESINLSQEREKDVNPMVTDSGDISRKESPRGYVALQSLGIDNAECARLYKLACDNWPNQQDEYLVLWHSYVTTPGNADNPIRYIAKMIRTNQLPPKALWNDYAVSPKATRKAVKPSKDSYTAKKAAIAATAAKYGL